MRKDWLAHLAHLYPRVYTGLMATRDELYRQALALRDSGHQCGEISKTLGVPRRTLQYWFARARDSADTSSRPQPLEQIKEADQNWTQCEQRLRSQSFTDPKQIEAMTEAALKSEISQPVVSPEKAKAIRKIAGSGDILRAAADLSDAEPEEWAILGETYCPDFLKSWQCGKLLFYLASGIHRAIALARVGVRLGDFEVWLARASNRVEPFVSFIELCSMAQASAYTRLQRMIMRKSPGWQALAWSLERLSPEIFARHVVDDDGPEDSSFAEVGDDNLKRAALAYIVSDNDRKAVEVEFVDLDEIEGRNE